ncbi:MAG: hypothetical protein AB7P35_17685 [Hyphomonadaceae bacterium]
MNLQLGSGDEEGLRLLAGFGAGEDDGESSGARGAAAFPIQNLRVVIAAAASRIFVDPAEDDDRFVGDPR